MLFNERELSKKDFERIDIDVRAMPKEIKEKLLNGELTPLLEIRDQMDNGVIATMPVKLRLERSEDGKAVLMAYPVSKDIVATIPLSIWSRISSNGVISPFSSFSLISLGIVLTSMSIRSKSFLFSSLSLNSILFRFTCLPYYYI